MNHNDAFETKRQAFHCAFGVLIASGMYNATRDISVMLLALAAISTLLLSCTIRKDFMFFPGNYLILMYLDSVFRFCLTGKLNKYFLNKNKQQDLCKTQ